MTAAVLVLRRVRGLGEEVASALWDAGTTGLWEVSAREWRAFFDRRCEGLDRELADSHPGLDARWENADPTDWAARYQKSLRPVSVGASFAILPAPGQSNPWRGRLAIRLAPGMAFGTGEHFTTASCLRLLEGVRPRPDSVLDVGCGSGILAIAAAKLGVPRVAACDDDRDAVRIAHRNAADNAAEVRFVAGGPEALSGTFGCVLANIQAEVLTELMAVLRRRLADDGNLILAGILCERWSRVRAEAEANGLALKELRSDGRWTSARVAP